MVVNILKKYSRAAGDRSQWKKVEAMFDNPKSAENEFLEGGMSRARIPLCEIQSRQWALGPDTNPLHSPYAVIAVIDLCAFVVLPIFLAPARF